MVHVIDLDLGRRDVGVEILEVLDWIGLRTKQRRLAHRQDAGFVDSPRPRDGIGVSQADVPAHVMREVHIVAAQRALDPRRHPNDGGAVDVVAQR